MSLLRPLLTSLGLILLCGAHLHAATEFISSATIEANSVELDLDDEWSHASGNACLSYGDFELCADDLTADRSTGEVVATGNLRLVQGDRRLSGDSANYNIYARAGSFKNARTVEQGVVIRGEKIVLTSKKVEARNATFTTCDQPEPHYTFAAKCITLTAEQPDHLRTPTSGRLSLSSGKILYRGKTILPLPGYSIRVGDIGTDQVGPAPVAGFHSDDGPFLSFGYTAGKNEGLIIGDFNYRYTTSRGIRGHAKLRRFVGASELTFGYMRREDPADRTIESDDLEADIADVLVDREPEYGIILPGYPLTRSLTAEASWLAGSYTEFDSQGTEQIAHANRASLNTLVTYDPYSISPSVRLSHAVGYRSSSYSPGERLTVRHIRHTADIAMNSRLRLEISHITRRQSGETPFLFDGVGPKREIIGEVTWTVNPAWRLRFVEYYDLHEDETRDMIVEATRTAHCLEYTVGWRQERQAVYVGFGLAPPSIAE